MDEILTSLKKSNRAAFRTREYAAMLNKKGYARLVLHRLKMAGGIVSVKNGWWAFPDSMPEAVASDMSNPGYVSFHSALFLHGLTTQTPMKVQIAVARKPKKYFVFGTEVKEYKIRNTQFTGFYRRDGILTASPEKAFADSLMHPKTCPEIVLMDALGEINTDKVALMLATGSAKKKLKRLIRHVNQR